MDILKQPAEVQEVLVAWATRRRFTNTLRGDCGRDSLPFLKSQIGEYLDQQQEREHL